MKVYSYIRHRYSYEKDKEEYIGTLVNASNEEELPIGTKFILATEDKTSNGKINYNVKKLIIKGEKDNEYIDLYKSFYEKHKDIINVCIGGLITLFFNIISHYFNINLS